MSDRQTHSKALVWDEGAARILADSRDDRDALIKTFSRNNTKLHLVQPAGDNHLTRQQWARRISENWRKAAEEMIARIFQTGRDLIVAKEELDHGEFEAMIEVDLPFGTRTAERLMAIARDERLKTTPGSLLPPSWRTLYEVTRLSDEEFHHFRDTGVIHADMDRDELAAAVAQRKRKPPPPPLIKPLTDDMVTIIPGDCRVVMRNLPAKSVHMIVTSPPYLGQRDYQVEGQIGLEKSIDDYILSLNQVFDEAWRVLRDDGTLWIVIGDSRVTKPPGNKPGTQKAKTGLPNSAENLERRRLNSLRLDKSKLGLRPKNLIGVPFRVTFALQERGWIWRSEITWHKPSVLPEPVTDRPTGCHEHILMFSKQGHYDFHAEAVTEPDVSDEKERRRGRGRVAYNGKCVGEAGTGQKSVVSVRADGRRNFRDVWTIPTESSDIGHFAPFPKALVKPPIMAGTSEWGCCSKCGAQWKEAAASCSCDAPAVPCTVLDFFDGSGTTGLVANALGRKAVLIDINPEYCGMARDRIERELEEYKAKCAREDAWGNLLNPEEAKFRVLGDCLDVLHGRE